MNYYKAFWDESRCDEFDSWGTCTYYFEVDDDDFVLKQLQIYENGTILKYKDDSILDDEYGGLTDQPLTKEDIELNGFPQISKDEFYNLWNSSKAINRN